MDKPLLKVTFPGRIHRRGSRWWWQVQLPGEDKPRTRPLKPRKAKTATDDRVMAEKIAFEMWEQALQETTERRASVEAEQKIAKLKAQFLERIQHFSEIVKNSMAKAEAEAQARVEAEAKLNKVLSSGVKPEACECCGSTQTPPAGLKRIDSEEHTRSPLAAPLYHTLISLRQWLLRIRAGSRVRRLQPHQR
jgi:hypothetical protein